MMEADVRNMEVITGFPLWHGVRMSSGVCCVSDAVRWIMMIVM